MCYSVTSWRFHSLPCSQGLTGEAGSSEAAREAKQHLLVRFLCPGTAGTTAWRGFQWMVQITPTWNVDFLLLPPLLCSQSSACRLSSKRTRMSEKFWEGWFASYVAAALMKSAADKSIDDRSDNRSVPAYKVPRFALFFFLSHSKWRVWLFNGWLE